MKSLAGAEWGMTFSRRYLERLEKGALKSHKRQCPGNYVAGDGRTFNHGVDYIEGGPVKFLTRQGAPELAPFICPTDILSSELLGWGLTDTTTLAEGAERCDVRFKKGGETRVAEPEPLEKWLRSRQT